MKFFIIFFFLFIQLLAFGNEERKTTLREGSLPLFKGLILVEDEEDLNLQGYHDVRGVLSYHVSLPVSSSTLQSALSGYFYSPLSKENILEIKRIITQFYRDNGRPVIVISVPQQDISNGVLQLVIIEGTLGEVIVRGNNWFCSERFEEAIRIQPGEVLSSGILNQDLYWMNRNPFRQIDALFTPGEVDGTTDIELIVSDRFPLRVYTGIDNTGNDVTGNNRFFAGFNWGNVFNTDQTLSYQYASDTNFDRFQSHTLFYEVPLPWRHLLFVYGGYSHVDAKFHIPQIKETKFRTHGFSVQASLRYDIPLKADAFLHEFMWGFDFKRTNNNLDFGGRPVISRTIVNLTQLMLGYNLGYESGPVTVSFEIEGFYSPGKWIADQTNRDYNALRPFAKNHYVYARSAFTLIWLYFEDWAMHNYLRGQVANNNLLPSEEYGVGGSNTVRGYKERIVNGDNAFIWNFELRTPAFSILRALSGWTNCNDECLFLVFFDYGWENVHHQVKGQGKSHHLVSVGPGVRYNINPYIQFKADWGFQLHHLPFEGPNKRLHFSLVAGY